MNHTLESLLELTKTAEGRQQIRVMVAEACGYALVPWQGIDFYYFKPTEKERVLARNGEMAGASREYTLPPYHTSLDAMAEAKKTLTCEQRGDFINHLCRVVYPTVGQPATAIEKSFFAEAWQEAVAFIITRQETTPATP